VQAGPRGAGRDADDRGGLGERQVRVVVQDDDGALRRREGEERLFDELAVR
jgi:hypothetical protein